MSETPLQKVRAKRKKAVIESADKMVNLDAATYTAWCNMLLRCYSTTHVAYNRYGGRGIGVHHTWLPPNLNKYVGRGASFIFNMQGKLPEEDRHAFDRFVIAVGIKPSKDHSLDRINADGHYEPNNVRWATTREQAVNKSVPAKKVPHPATGEPVLAADLARELGISYQLMRARFVKAGTWNKFDPPEKQPQGDA